MADEPPHLYVDTGVQLGRDADVMLRASRERTKQLRLGLTPILTLGHLAYLTGASYGYLREIVERRRDPYVDIALPKRSCGTRPISSPDPPLMQVQRWLLREALKTVQLHDSCYAYRTGRGIAACASQHLGARWLVKLDLHDFFGTIDEQRVYRVFASLGYAPLVCFELSRLTTRTLWPTVPQQRFSRDEWVIPAYAVAQSGRLPQGGPTSGALANAVATPLDRGLSQLADAEGWTYTRYSDDLTFSTARSIHRDDARRLIRLAEAAVRQAHFEIHVKKTRVVPPGSRHVVLGLVVDGRAVRLMPEFKRRVEVHIRGVQQFGLADHVSHRGFRSIFSFISHVDGCLRFAHDIDPGWAEIHRQRWDEALRGSTLPI